MVNEKNTPALQVAYFITTAKGQIKVFHGYFAMFFSSEGVKMLFSTIFGIILHF